MAWQYPDGAVLTRDDADEPGVLTLRYGDVELRVVRAGIDDGYTPEVIWRDGREIARIERAHRLESRRDPAGLGGERYAVPVHYPPGTATWVVTGHPAVDESVMYDATSALMAIARAERDTWDVQ